MSLCFKQTSSELRNEWPNGPPRDSVFNVSASASRSWLSNSFAFRSWSSWFPACRDRSHSACNSEALWHTDLFHLLSPFPPIVNWYSTYLIYLTYLLVVVAGLVVLVGLVGLVVVVMDVVAVVLSVIWVIYSDMVLVVLSKATAVDILSLKTFFFLF